VGLLAAAAQLPTNAQVAIPDDFVLPSSAANTAEPGFLWRMFQNQANTENSNAKTERALAGLLVDAEGNPLPNLADPFAVGNADGEGTKLGTADNALYEFEISGVINLDQAGGSNGRIQPDEQMPGIPGIEGSTDGIAAEVLTWLDLPAGTHTIIVNSDDGFLLRMGGAAPQDPVGSVFVGEFNGGRGAADTTMQINVETAGLYATRLTWEEGGGGANIEFVELLDDGTYAAINSPESTIKAYRAVTGNIPAYVSKAIPAPDSTGANFDTTIEIDITGTVDQASVALSIDGQPVTATVNQAGGVTSIRHVPTTRFGPNSEHEVTLNFNDGQARTVSWNFTVASYALLTADLKVTPDTTKPGFIWDVHQNEAFQNTDNFRPLSQLAGILGTNLADASAQSIAIAPGTPNADGWRPMRFEIETVINLDEAAGANGEFTPDDQMPGIPGLTGLTDGIAADIITYIDLPAGTNIMIVNSDDGFITYAGNTRDVIQGLVAGEFGAGRGAADTSFRVIVDEAGVYPFRTVWNEGGGGANIEWKIEKADGTRALINDTANGGPASYRAVTTGLPAAAVTWVKPTPNNQQAGPGTTIEAIIEDGGTPVDAATVRLAIDGTEVNATATKSGSVTTVVYDPATDFALGSSHTARLTFGASEVREWSFAVPSGPVTRDAVAGHAGFIIAGADFTEDAAGRTGQPGDFGMDFGTGVGVVNVTDASFFNTGAADDRMTVAYFQKLHQVQNSSSFWANSPGSGSSTRGFQAHTPWGDSTIYFDTTGCCTAETQRINRNIADYENYTGDPVWWEDWHHFAFVKNGETKEIYVDGDLFHSTIGDPLPFPLPRDFRNLIIGGGPLVTDNRMAGILDDFVVFDAALTAAQLEALAGGTAPSAITGNPGLLAHWDFNDADGGGGGETPTLGVARSEANIIVTFTGTLESADTVTGPWAPVGGATSPATIPATGGPKFYRARE
jgi:hypothetical protein